MSFTDPSPSKNTILFCATDPGGANNVGPVAAELRDQFSTLVLCSARTQKLFDDLSVSAEVAEISDYNAACRILTEIQPDIIVLGTSVPDRPEALLTQAANALGVPTIAILDEWYLYALRFQSKDGRFTHLPTAICCQDELARNEAIAEGIPDHLLKITGSPALSLMFDQIRENRQLTRNTLVSSTPTLLFISEQMAAAFGSAPGESGFVGNFMGYTELEVRNDIADILTQLGQPCQVFEKLHPNEFELIAPPERGTNVDWRIMLAGASLSDAIQGATAVIGMRSIALLEAAMMENRPASYQPGRLGKDQCTAVRLGLADRLSTKDALKEWMEYTLFCNTPSPSQIDRPLFATTEAITNVCAIVETELYQHW